MNMKKNLLIAASVATIGVGALGIGVANAAPTASGTSIVDKLVAKFGLNKADVQAVFDEERTAREAERMQKLSDKLAAGVKAGTITQAQSDAITAKVKELQASREANRDKMESMTDDERKTAMESKRADLKTWVSENNIPNEFARLLHMGGGHGVPIGDMAPPSNGTSTSTN